MASHRRTAQQAVACRPGFKLATSQQRASHGAVEYSPSACRWPRPTANNYNTHMQFHNCSRKQRSHTVCQPHSHRLTAHSRPTQHKAGVIDNSLNLLLLNNHSAGTFGCKQLVRLTANNGLELQIHSPLACSSPKLQSAGCAGLGVHLNGHSTFKIIRLPA